MRAPASPRAAAGTLASGLALGSRPTYLVCGAMFAVPRLWRRPTGYPRRALGLAFAGFSAAAAGDATLLAAVNQQLATAHENIDAMAAGVSTRVWELSDIVALLSLPEEKAAYSAVYGELR